MRRHLTLIPLVPLVVLPLVLAACGSSSSSSGSTTNQSAGTTTVTAASSSKPTVMLASTGLGKVLVGSNGRTVYLFEKDTGSTSTCYTGCDSLWPPLTAKGKPVAGAGVNAAMLGTTTRKDGTKQVTYNGHPLYYYAKDTKAGQTNGQDVLGIWYVVGANGQKVEKESSGGSSTGSSGGGGYGGY